MTYPELTDLKERLLMLDGGPLPRIQEEHGTIEITDAIRLGPAYRTYSTVEEVLVDYPELRDSQQKGN